MNARLLKKAQKWATSWSSRLLCPIPIPGHATTSQWKKCVDGTTKVPGRNHPTVGQWLLHRYGGPQVVAADPMVGAGGLWIDGREFVKRLYANECEKKLVRVANDNLVHAGYDLSSYYGGWTNNDDARTWQPSNLKVTPTAKKADRVRFLPVDLVLTSPPFGRPHDAGNTGANVGCVDRKNLHASQSFGKDPRNVGRLKGWRLWEALLQIYSNMFSYLKKGGTALVILRNHIRQDSEVDDIGVGHLPLFRMAGFRIEGLHPREVWVTGHRAVHVYEHGAAYTDLEWVAVLTK